MQHLERRIRAAQQLAGFDSLDDLADKIGRPGLSRKTLRRIASENDPRTAKDYELAWIAEACEVPLEFFTDEDGRALGQLDRIEQQIQWNRELLEIILRQLGITDARQAAGLRVPRFSDELRALLRPPAATPRPAREDTA